jgi:pilus assembly protein CpaC
MSPCTVLARPGKSLQTVMLLIASLSLTTALAAEPAKPAVLKTAAVVPTATIVLPLQTEIAPPMRLTLGKSSLLRLPEDVTRISVGNPETVDVILINPRELYLLGKKIGPTNVFLWTKSGTTIMDVSVSIDTTALQDKLKQLMPGEKTITVSSAGESLVLSGLVADAIKVQRAVFIAEQFGGKKVINMLQTGNAAQVMIEVKVAEVSKTLIDKLGSSFTGSRNTGNFTYSLITNFLTGSAGAAAITQGTTALSLDAEITSGLIKILAEPTIMAISGQEGAFLAGGKIFIPVPQSGGIGTAAAITLQEETFGVGLKFTPTVLEGGLINLRVTPEVSEPSKEGLSVQAGNGATAVLPTIITRRASTTVQLYDGQTFAIGGLIKNNVVQAVKKWPGLGEIPILGALFRSSSFARDLTELLFIVTPRLVKPTGPNYALPTDNYIDPTRAEFFLEGRSEGKPRPAPAPTAGTAPRGYEVK